MLQKITESYNFCGLIVLINALKDNRKFTQKLTQYSFIKIKQLFDIQHVSCGQEKILHLKYILSLAKLIKSIVM